MESTMLGLSQEQFDKISRLVHELSGIDLKMGKEALVTARLVKRLRTLNITSFDEYLKRVESEKLGEELSAMIESLTTNKTSFFRESAHFDFLRQHILPSVGSLTRGVKIWSAGCSSGEEPYSIAITLRETLSEVASGRARVLATDICTNVLDKARRAVYASQDPRELPLTIVEKYFTRIDGGYNGDLKVKDGIRNMIRFARLNMMDQWPMTGPFDVIFCRNVMIYFDKPTRQNLVRRFSELLTPGGHLFVGHSESLTGISHDLEYVQPATYVKPTKP